MFRGAFRRMARFLGAASIAAAAIVGNSVARLAAGGEKYALLVAVDRVADRSFRRLDHARDDVIDFAAALLKSGYRAERVVVMHDDLDELTSRYGEEKARDHRAESAKIRAELDRLVAALDRDDTLVVAFSGHGLQLFDPKKPDDADASRFHLCPIDADLKRRETFVSLGEVYDRLESCRASRKLVLIDACREDSLTREAQLRAIREVDGDARPLAESLPKETVALFSCARGQFGRESGTLEHGLFFHHVVAGWKGERLRDRSPDADNDGQLTVDEFAEFVTRATTEHSRTALGKPQTPERAGKVTGKWVLRSLKRSDDLTGADAGQEWNVNGLKMTFCWCPDGTFEMGSPPREKGRTGSEGQVSVPLTGFWLGKHEVTQSEWSTVMNTTISAQRDRAGRSNKLYGEGPTFPIYYVNHDEATAFARKFTQQEADARRLPEGWEYRLPTEAQWEYGCRAETKTSTAFGDRLDSRAANFDGNRPYNGAAKGPFKGLTTMVGSYPPNAWNLHDMHGNVWEWCRDSYEPTLPGGKDPEATKASTQRVLRGGSWSLDGSFCRSASRQGQAPTYRLYSAGFRLALVRVGP